MFSSFVSNYFEMKRIAIFLIFCWMVLDGVAQSGTTISGKVISEEGPVAFVNVGLKGTSYGSFSDEEGNFTIENVKAGNYVLLISGIGYQNYEQQIMVEGNAPIKLNQITLKEEAIGLDEVVVVSATMKEISKMDSPVPVDVYQPAYFKMNPVSSVFEGLQTINGVRPQLNCNVCNTGDIHINGLEGPYTMVLLDGMPIVSGLSTVYGLSGIPNSLIERMEIVKGSASALYGSEAVGGLINIITKNPNNAPLVSVDAFGTSWMEFNTDIGVKLKTSEDVASLFGVNYFNYQNPIDNNGDGFTDLTQQHRISVFNKWNFKRNHNRLASIAGRYFYEDRWGGEMNWTKDFRGGDQIYGESIYTSRVELVGTYQLPVPERITFSGSYNQHHQNSVYGDMRFNADQNIAYGQLIWDKHIASHSLLTGATYRYTFYDDNTTATASSDENEPSKVHLPGFFVQDNWTMKPKHNLLLGLRYDYDTRHGDIWSPRLAYKWKANGNNVVRFNFGTGFRVVNLFTEDHAALTGARDVVIMEELKPEQSYNTSLNYIHKFIINHSILTMDLSGWYTYFTNKIIPDYDTDPNLIIYDNLDGHAVSRGVSMNLNYASYSPWRANLGVTVMDVSNTERNEFGEMETTRQILTERFMGTWTLSYSWYNIGLSVDYTGNLYGPMRLPLLGDLDPRDEFSPVWSIQNIQFTKSFNKNWEIYGGVKNLLNFTPPSNAIARAFDPFDRGVDYDNQGNVLATDTNPYALTFDPSYVYAPNQGIRGFLGFRYTIK